LSFNEIIEGKVMDRIVKICKKHGFLSTEEVYLTKKGPTCRKCRLLNSKKFYILNTDKIKKYYKKYNKKYYLLNKDKISKKSKKYYKLNKDKILENFRKWYLRNKQKLALKRKKGKGTKND
jgi:hypothetical protein